MRILAKFGIIPPWLHVSSTSLCLPPLASVVGFAPNDVSFLSNCSFLWGSSTQEKQEICLLRRGCTADPNLYYFWNSFGLLCYCNMEELFYWRWQHYHCLVGLLHRESPHDWARFVCIRGICTHYYYCFAYYLPKIRILWTERGQREWHSVNSSDLYKN